MANKYLIVGGEFENKGAEAMTFSTIQYLRKNVEDVDIYMLLDEKHMDRVMLPKCGVSGVLDQPSRRMYAAGGFDRFTTLIRGKDKSIDFKYLDTLLNDIAAVIDISGYGFTSAWGVVPGLSSCAILKAAKKHNTPYYIMPQSFGPFNYNWSIKWFMRKKIKAALASAEHIFAREKEGYNLLTEQFKLTNVEKAYDMVLQQKASDPAFIFVDSIDQQDVLEINRTLHNVAIIPNIRNEKYETRNNILKFYKDIIDWLRDRKYDVCLISHSKEDDAVCEEIKNLYKNDMAVKLVERELSCIEYEKEIVKFDFCIASRYHSIIHAYKQHIPCIALGWATKYRELLDLFNQEEYLVEISGIQEMKGAKLCSQMTKNLEYERHKISRTMEKVQSKNCLDILRRL